MSTGSISLDILLDQIQQDAISKSDEGVAMLLDRYPKLSEKEAKEIHKLVAVASKKERSDSELVVTAPLSFALKTKVTKVVVKTMIEGAKSSIVITGYSLSDYFADLVDCIIKKSQEGILVKFFVNNIDSQISMEKLSRYKGKFLRLYNYPKQEDSMSALHAKVISVDNRETLITSANLSYHGQEGNIELGTHIISNQIAKQVDDVFTTLLFKKVFEEI